MRLCQPEAGQFCSKRPPTFDLFTSHRRGLATRQPATKGGSDWTFWRTAPCKAKTEESDGPGIPHYGSTYLRGHRMGFTGTPYSSACPRRVPNFASGGEPISPLVGGKKVLTKLRDFGAGATSSARNSLAGEQPMRLLKQKARLRGLCAPGSGILQPTTSISIKAEGKRRP